MSRGAWCVVRQHHQQTLATASSMCETPEVVRAVDGGMNDEPMNISVSPGTSTHGSGGPKRGENIGLWNLSIWSCHFIFRRTVKPAIKLAKPLVHLSTSQSSPVMALSNARHTCHACAGLCLHCACASITQTNQQAFAHQGDVSNCAVDA